jgi:flagellar hook-length control protein FliK
MKTPPVNTQSTGSASKASQMSDKPKAESKPPQKEFKKVLDDKSEPRPKSSLQGKMQKGGLKHDKPMTAHQPMTPAGRKPVSAKSDHEDADEFGFSKKEEPRKKAPKEELKEFSISSQLMGPAPIHNKAEVQKAHGPALNIKEIESIVQKVQVGMNEKGLPEMNFELLTDKLGPLNLKISSENEKIKIQFVTQDASAQAELQKGINELSQLLGQRGLNLSETNVMTRDQQSQQQQKEGGRGDSSSEGPDAVGKTRARKRVVTGRTDDGFTI